MADQHESDMVEVVNKVNRGTKLIPRVDLDVFLRKHTLYQVIQESPTVEPKRKGRKPGKKAAPVVKDIEKKRRGRYDLSGGCCVIIYVENRREWTHRVGHHRSRVRRNQ